MISRSLLLLALLAGTACAQEDRGSIGGVVRFTGEVPPAQKVPTTDGGLLLHRDLIVDAATKGLASVVVHVETAPASAKANTKRVTIDQRDMLFLPRVVAVEEGQPVRFENNDLCNHAVQAFSAVGENTFNVTTPPSQPFDFRFKAQKTPVVIGCPLHGWMRAWVFVFAHPHFAVTDKEGRFQLPGLAPGKHTLIFRHADTGLSERRVVEVEAGKSARVELEWAKAPAP